MDTEGTRDRPTVSDNLHSTSALVGGTTANNDVIELGDANPNRTSEEPTNTSLPDNTSDVTDGDASSDVSRISASSNDYVSLSSKPVIQDSLYDHTFLLNANIVYIISNFTRIVCHHNSSTMCAWTVQLQGRTILQRCISALRFEAKSG